jgi:UDP-N-acetylmuramate--alanine ligase
MSVKSNKSAQTWPQMWPGMHIHLVGIGGAGMSAIARVLLGRGYRVSGSDMDSNEQTESLTASGATIFKGHDSAYIKGADLLVVSSAIPPTNPEWAAARGQDIPVMKRADLIGNLMTGNVGIAIAGTHGKTTTTGMVAHLLIETGFDPTVILGGTLPELGGNGRFGRGPHFVVEADEYDYMFLGLRPEIAVITNVEHDHPDLFPTLTTYQDAFRQFVDQMADQSRLFVCADDPGILDLLDDPPLTRAGLKTYGLDVSGIKGRALDFCALDLRPNQMGGTDFVVAIGGHSIGLARIRVPGNHNVRNALAAIALGRELGIDFAQICRALASFGGVRRRFQMMGEVADIMVIDDYAHHPTEIKVTLAAARQRFPGRRLWAVWQPHTFSRTRLLMDEFAESFREADRVIALDIYRSRESNDTGISTTDVVSRMAHPNVVYIPGREEAAAYLLERVNPGDVILTLGAGDGNLVGEWVLNGLKQQRGVNN